MTLTPEETDDLFEMFNNQKEEIFDCLNSLIEKGSIQEEELKSLTNLLPLIIEGMKKKEIQQVNEENFGSEFISVGAKLTLQKEYIRRFFAKNPDLKNNPRCQDAISFIAYLLVIKVNDERLSFDEDFIDLAYQNLNNEFSKVELLELLYWLEFRFLASIDFKVGNVYCEKTNNSLGHPLV